MQYTFKIIEYKILNDTVESFFKFQVFYRNNSTNDCIYNLKIPSNPLVDIDILNLHEKDTTDVLERIKYLVNKKRYSYKTNLALELFITWLLVLTNYNSNPGLLV